MMRFTRLQSAARNGLLLSILTLSAFYSVKSQTPILFFQPVAAGLSQPLDVVNAGDGTNRLFIVEQAGRIKIFSGGAVDPVPFLDLTGTGLITTAGGERGLLSMAFHPDYKNNGYFFIFYTKNNPDPTPDGDLEISRFKVSPDPDVADVSSGKVVLTIPHQTYENHNGGKLLFGHDTSLYLSTGDGGSAYDPDNNGQSVTTLLGKMLRILVNDSTDVAPYYTAPTDNPYASVAGARSEIFSIGLRNPFRWSFDRNGTGPWDMWIGDVGQGAWEEINFRAAGMQKSNFGWRCYEGNQNTPILTPCSTVPPDTVNPFHQYDRGSNGGRAVTGGIVYRGATYPAMQGWYSAIDFYTGNGWLIKADRTRPAYLQRSLPIGIAAFGESESREIYAVSLTSGSLYQVQLAGIVPVKLISFTAEESNGQHLIRWKTAMEENMERFDLQFSTNGIDFKTIITRKPANAPNGQEYAVSYPIATSTNIFYRLVMSDKDGKVDYSETLHLKGRAADIIVTPTIARNNKINLQTRMPISGAQIIDMNGQVRFSSKQKLPAGSHTINIQGLIKGVYIIRLVHASGEWNQKIFIE